MKRRGNREVEIKLAVRDLAALRRRLARLGAHRLGRVREMNTLFDTPRQTLLKRGRLLRLRLENRRAVLTYKGPAPRGTRYKMREEVEVPVPHPAQLRAILEAIGLRAAFRYEKFRTSYRLPRLMGLQVELDVTPIGVFVELEGPGAAIDRAARLLGYGPADYITKSYRALYLDHRRRRGLRARDMVFTSRKK